MRHARNSHRDDCLKKNAYFRCSVMVTRLPRRARCGAGWEGVGARKAPLPCYVRKRAQGHSLPSRWRLNGRSIFLNFLPLPHGQESLRPTFGVVRTGSVISIGD